MGVQLMSASLAGSLKVLIESAGLGLSAYRDNASASVTGTAWVTITEGVSTTTVAIGDHGQADTLTELVQVDLWQPWRAAVSGDPAEDYTLADRLHAAIHGATLPDPPMLVRSCTVDSYPRFVEEDENLVHHAFTVRIARDRAPAVTSA